MEKSYQRLTLILTYISQFQCPLLTHIILNRVHPHPVQLCSLLTQKVLTNRIHSHPVHHCSLLTQKVLTNRVHSHPVHHCSLLTQKVLTNRVHSHLVHHCTLLTHHNCPLLLLMSVVKLITPQTNTQDCIEQIHQPTLHKLLSQHQLPTLLMDVFPTSYKYIFKSFEAKASSNINAPSFSAVVHISNVRTEEQAIQWIKDLESHTSTTYRISRGNQCKGKRIVYKTDRHCQHTRKKLSEKQKQCVKKRMTISRDKKTDCPTRFTLKVHANQAAQPPSELTLNWEHNHSMQSAHALSFRPVSEGTVSKFEE